MTDLEGTKLISCEHNYVYQDSTKLKGIKESRKCSKCSCTKNVTWNGLFELQNAPLVDVIVTKRKYISWRTDLKRRKIILRKDLYITQYFAQKKTAQIALALFQDNPAWSDIFVEVPFKGGVVQADLQRASFYMYFDACLDCVEGVNVWKLNKSLIVKYAKIFTVSKISSFVASGSKLERLIAKLTKNSLFTKKL